jgi:HTH-type transcriptional regulator/antitoxin HigA
MNLNYSKKMSKEKNNIIHPGLTLEENLDFLNISNKELSLRTGISHKHILDILKGEASITADTAIKFEKVLNIKASFWNNLESNYKAEIAEIKEVEFLENEKKILPLLRETYNELALLGFMNRISWIPKNMIEIVKSLQLFWGVSSLELIPGVNEAAFRKYDRKNINEYTISAILRIAEIYAQKTEVNLYSKKVLQNNLPILKEISEKENFDENIDKLKQTLRECGIVLVCIPGFKNTHIQGITKWVSSDKALIVIKTTKQSEDKFWFTLMHEIGHIIKHSSSKKKTFIDIDNTVDNQQEIEANNYANKFFMPGFDKRELDRYISNSTFDINSAVNALSKDYGVSKSIIAGRINHEFKDVKKVYRDTSKYIARIDYHSFMENTTA